MKKVTTLLQKFGLSSFVILLLLVNILFGMIILQKPKSMDHSNVISTKELEFYIQMNASISEDILTYSLNSIIPNVIGQHLVLFIPPYPCSSCVDIQNQTLCEYAEDSLLELLVVVPYEHERDIKAQFSEINEGLNIKTYDKNNLPTESILTLQGPLLIKINHGIVEDFFITSQWNPQASITYIQSY